MLKNVDLTSLSDEANKYGDDVDADQYPHEVAIKAFQVGFKRCIDYVETRSAQGMNLTEILWELKIIVEK